MDRVEQTGKCYAVFVNSDLNEGRGVEVVGCVCEMETTAIRKARGADTQGTDGRVEELPLLKVPTVRGAYTYGPVTLVRPSKEDKAEGTRLDRKRQIVMKAVKLGLTSEELEVLMGKKQ